MDIEVLGRASTVATEAAIVEIEYFSKENKRSVYNICPTIVRIGIERQAVRDLLIMDERELRAMIKPSLTLNRLRMNFWKEFDRAQGLMTPMRVGAIYTGVCPREQFEGYTNNDNFLSWVLKPPVNYVNAMDEALSFGIERMRELMELPFYSIQSVKVSQNEFEDREVLDVKAAELVLKAYAMVELRVKGALPQKIEQSITSNNRSINATVNLGVNDDPTFNIENKIKEIESSLAKDLKKLQKPIIKKNDVKEASERGVTIEVIEKDMVEPEDIATVDMRKFGINPDKVKGLLSSDDL